MAGERSFLTVTTDTNHNDADQNIDALMTGRKWDTTVSNNITFSFLDHPFDISYNPIVPGQPTTFAGSLSALQITAARFALSTFAGVADVTFTELAYGSQHGTMRFFEVNNFPTAFGYFPSSSEQGGDIAFNSTGYDNPYIGTFDYATFLHEIGHAMGLKHGHEENDANGTNVGTMTADKDSSEYSLMTYNSHIGHNQQPAFSVAETNSHPQTLMMYDIAALHRLYGANYNHRSGDTVYSFDPTNGESYVDGVLYLPSNGGKIFQTIWDGNGKDTYDLSNYTTDLSLDLRPGEHSDFDVGGNNQRAQLNRGIDSTGTFVGASEYEWARGHLFNALQHNGDARSLIENAKGGSGDDKIRGNSADNSLYGGSGNDTLYGSSGDDNLYGGSGSDKYYGGSGDDFMKAGGGAESFFGGSGTDYLNYYDSSSGVTVNLATNSVSGSWASNDTISSIEGITSSRTGDDKITGTSGANIIKTSGGDDSIYAGGGSDKVYAGSGDDYVRVGGGVESFFGGSGTDYISYYDSSGGITINLATDSVSGSWASNDVVQDFEGVSGSGTGDDKITGTSGANTLRGYGGDDSFWGGSGNDKVYGGSGDDYVRVGGGVESFYGGSGSDDYISYYDSSGGIKIDLAANTISGSWGSNDVISGFESVGGSNTGGDTMYGTSGANRFKGYGGDDRFYAGSGNDKVYGGSGDDYVRVGGGVESFYGGSGTDYISYYDSSGGITINLATDSISGSWGSNDVVKDFEGVSGSNTGNDKIYGTSGANTLRGYGGDDSFWGGSGNDKVYGGSGDDYMKAGGGVESFYGGSGSDDFISYHASSSGVNIDLDANTISGSWGSNDKISGFESASGSNSGNDKMYGTAGANRLKGNGGDDSLYGRSGNDKLYGGSGKDRFDGGNGDDTLYGGSGDDIFHFDRGEDNDIIKDFENNDDTIQFDNFGYLTDAASALAFATETGGDVLFNFGADGTLRVENATKAQLVNDIEIV